MNDLILNTLRADPRALDSLDTFTQAALTLGYSQREIDRALDELDGFPLDDDALEQAAGGLNTVKPPLVNRTLENY